MPAGCARIMFVSPALMLSSCKCGLQFGLKPDMIDIGALFRRDSACLIKRLLRVRAGYTSPPEITELSSLDSRIFIAHMCK